MHVDSPSDDGSVTDVPVDDAATSDGEAPSKLEEKGTMLEHPVFVYWCRSCGLEASDDEGICTRCGDTVVRHQRVMELPDSPVLAAGVRGSRGDGLLSLKSLRAALADISVGEDAAGAAVLLFEQGADPDVEAAAPAFARRLASWAVPPPVQRALYQRGFTTWEQLMSTVSAASDADSLTKQLGLSTPAVEVLLRRLWHAAADGGEVGRLAEHAHVNLQEKRRVRSRPSPPREAELRLHSRCDACECSGDEGSSDSGEPCIGLTEGRAARAVMAEPLKRPRHLASSWEDSMAFADDAGGEGAWGGRMHIFQDGEAEEAAASELNASEIA